MTTKKPIDRHTIFNDPKNSFFAIYNSSDEVKAVKAALADAGVNDEQIEVLLFDAETDELVQPEDGGFTKRFRQLFAADAVEVEEHYVEAVRKGYPVVVVHVQKEDDAHLKRVRKLLLDHEGKFVHYFGQWSFENISRESA